MNGVQTKNIRVENFADFDGHERVVACTDEATGLKAWIAIHNRNLGPALGGCRMRAYESDNAAITDALRLSSGMTYKAAMADLPLGGGKAVINCHPSRKTAEMMRSFGDCVESLAGAYITAEDSGTTVADMQEIRKRTAHVAGFEEKTLSDGRVVDGDPSRSTAYGVLKGIEAAVRFRLNVSSLEGIRIAVQGVGHVGYHVCHLLAEAGADLIIADVDPVRIERVSRELDVMVVNTNEVHRCPCDVFAPCALGGVISFDSLNEMPAQIIAGSANNQLASDAEGYELFARGKLYAPDYVINAGGIIDIWYEREGYDDVKVRRHIERIDDTLTDIFEASRHRQLPTHVVANGMAAARFQPKKVDVA